MCAGPLHAASLPSASLLLCFSASLPLSSLLRWQPQSLALTKSLLVRHCMHTLRSPASFVRLDRRAPVRLALTSPTAALALANGMASSACPPAARTLCRAVCACWRANLDQPSSPCRRDGVGRPTNDTAQRARGRARTSTVAQTTAINCAGRRMRYMKWWVPCVWSPELWHSCRARSQ